MNFIECSLQIYASVILGKNNLSTNSTGYPKHQRGNKPTQEETRTTISKGRKANLSFICLFLCYCRLNVALQPCTSVRRVPKRLVYFAGLVFTLCYFIFTFFITTYI